MLPLISVDLHEIEQRQICQKYSADYVPAPSGLKVGIAESVGAGVLPINGLRHNPDDGTSGWFIWAGEEYSDAQDFFKPLHIEHLNDWNPIIAKYLGLAPGWRFLITDSYEDVWFDESLLAEA